MRLPKGFLKDLADNTKFSVRYLSDLANASKRPGRNRAKELEDQFGVPAFLWLYGSPEEIKRSLLSSKY